MNAKIKEFLISLLSRKFLLTVAGAIALYNNKQYGEVVVLVLGYLGVEGGADLVDRYKGGTLNAHDVQNAVSQNDDSDVDTSKVVPGNVKPLPTPMFNEEIKE